MKYEIQNKMIIFLIKKSPIILILDTFQKPSINKLLSVFVRQITENIQTICKIKIGAILYKKKNDLKKRKETEI